VAFEDNRLYPSPVAQMPEALALLIAGPGEPPTGVAR